MIESHIELPQPQKTMSLGLGSTRFARHYSGYLLLDFFSWRYWDVSIPSVCLRTLLYSCTDNRTLLLPGFPIQTHTDHHSCGSSPYSFVAFYVFRRQYVPRHPSRALSRLSTYLYLSSPICRSLSSPLNTHFRVSWNSFLKLLHIFVWTKSSRFLSISWTEA